jgi:tetratricopeptide (TPR) repeat protein
MGLLSGAYLRYQMEFAPALVLLAAVGLLGVESTLAGRPRWRIVARVAWGAMIVYSVGFSLLYGFVQRAELQGVHGSLLLMSGETQAAISRFETSLHSGADPGATHLFLAVAYCRNDQLREAQAQFEQALRSVEPQEMATAYGIYGKELIANKHPTEALARLEAGLRLNPNSVDLHNSLSVALSALDRGPEALVQVEAAVRLAPGDVDAQGNLGVLLAKAGRWDEAIIHLRQALRIDPKRLTAHSYLAAALLQRGQVDEAISHFEEALRIDPNFEPAIKSLRLLGRPVPSSR